MTPILVGASLALLGIACWALRQVARAALASIALRSHEEQENRARAAKLQMADLGRRRFVRYGR